MLRPARLLLPPPTSQAPVPASQLKALPKDSPSEAAGAVANRADLGCKPRKRSASSGSGSEGLASGCAAKASRQATDTGPAAARAPFRSPPSEVAEDLMPFSKFDAAAHMIRHDMISGFNVLDKLQQVFEKCGFQLDTVYLELPATGQQQSAAFKCVVSSGGEILGMASAGSKRAAKCFAFQDVWDRLASFPACSNCACATSAPHVHKRHGMRGKRKKVPRNLVGRTFEIRRGGQCQETQAMVQEFASYKTSSTKSSENGASVTRELERGESTKEFAAVLKHSVFDKTRQVRKQTDAKAVATVEQRKISRAAAPTRVYKKEITSESAGRKPRSTKYGNGTPRKFKNETERLSEKISGLMRPQNPSVSQKSTSEEASSEPVRPLAFRYDISSVAQCG